MGGGDLLPRHGPDHDTRRVIGDPDHSNWGHCRRRAMPTHRRVRVIAVVLAVLSTLFMGIGTSSASATSFAPAAFVHPGLFDSTAQLDCVNAKLAAGAPPWASAY